MGLLCCSTNVHCSTIICVLLAANQAKSNTKVYSFLFKTMRKSLLRVHVTYEVINQPLLRYRLRMAFTVRVRNVSST